MSVVDFVSPRSPGQHGGPADRGLLRLRLAEFGRFFTPEAVQVFTAEALDIMRERGGREANRYLLEKIGTRLALDLDEGYFAEALQFHLGLVYGHAGQPEKMAGCISLSKTMPGPEDDRLYSDHVASSQAMRDQQRIAIARGMPAILFACLPRSGSATVAHTLAQLCDLPVMHLGVGRFPDQYLAPPWLDMFLEGGAVNRDPIAANHFNLGVLASRGARDVFVTIRDPRAAACSAVLNALSAQQIPPSAEAVEGMIERECLSSTIPWLQGWLEAARDPDFPLRVHWVPFKQTAADVPETIRRIAGILAEQYPSFRPIAERERIDEVRLNFSTGNDDALLNRLSAATQERLAEAVTPELRDLLDQEFPAAAALRPVARKRGRGKKKSRLQAICVGTGRDGTQSLARMVDAVFRQSSDKTVMHEYCCREFHQAFSEYRENGEKPAHLKVLKRMVAECDYDCIVGNGYAAVLPLFAEHYEGKLTLVHLRRRDRDACIASQVHNCLMFPAAYKYYLDDPAAISKRMAGFHFGEMAKPEWDLLSLSEKFGWYYDKTHALISESSSLFERYVEIDTEDLNDEATRRLVGELFGAAAPPPAAHLNASRIDISSFPKEHRHWLHWLMGRFNIEELAADEVYGMDYFLDKFVAWTGYQIRNDPALAPAVPPSAMAIRTNLDRALQLLKKGVRDIEGLQQLLDPVGLELQRRETSPRRAMAKKKIAATPRRTARQLSDGAPKRAERP